MGIRPGRLLLLLLAGAVAGLAAGTSAGCTLERRPDVQPDDAAVARESPAELRASAEDSARAVVSAFREALVLGDGSRVAALTVPGALLVDQEEGVRWRRATEPSGSLPTPLGAPAGGLSWTVTTSEYMALEDAGVLITRYRAQVVGEEVPWSAVESFVLVRTPEGWKIRYLHRSRGLEGAGRAP